MWKLYVTNGCANDLLLYMFCSLPKLEIVGTAMIKRCCKEGEAFVPQERQAIINSQKVCCHLNACVGCATVYEKCLRFLTWLKSLVFVPGKALEGLGNESSLQSCRFFHFQLNRDSWKWNVQNSWIFCLQDSDRSHGSYLANGFQRHDQAQL